MAINYLEQKRLLYAMTATNKVGRDAKNLTKKEKSKNYDGMIKKVPAYIQKNGFVYTMAFLNEKDQEVFYDIWRWHCDTSLTHNEIPLNEQRWMSNTTKDKFLKELFELKDMNKLRAITLETLAIMKCFRRFVKDED